MKKPWLFLLIGGAVLGAGLLLKNSLTNSVSFIIRKLKIGWEGISPTVDVTIGILNLTPASVTVYGMIGTLYLNGSKLGDVAKMDSVVVTGVGETPFTFRVKIALSGVAEQISDVIDIINGSRGIAANMRFVGSVNVAGIPYPLDLSYSII